MGVCVYVDGWMDAGGVELAYSDEGVGVGVGLGIWKFKIKV